MSDDWDFYFSRVNDALSSIFVDLGIRATAPDSQRPHLIWLWVPMQAARDDGLSSDVESPTLHAIEDAVAPLLAARNGAVLVGRITGSRRREYYFYGQNADGLAATIREGLLAFPAYAPEFGEQLDAGWHQYLGLLHPSVRQLEQIKNRRVIAALENAGDSLSTPRPIAHWIYCKHAADREAISSQLVANGFRVSNSASPETPTPFPLGVRLERSDRAEQAAVDEAVFQILDTMNGYDAIYDGWESPVVR